VRRRVTAKSTCLSWSKAPARNVSAHTSAGLKPLRLKWYAYLVHVVVLPQPCGACELFAEAGQRDFVVGHT
jgi:hypothetical protein